MGGPGSQSWATSPASDADASAPPEPGPPPARLLLPLSGALADHRPPVAVAVSPPPCCAARAMTPITHDATCEGALSMGATTRSAAGPDSASRVTYWCGAAAARSPSERIAAARATPAPSDDGGSAACNDASCTIPPTPPRCTKPTSAASCTPLPVLQTTCHRDAWSLATVSCGEDATSDPTAAPVGAAPMEKAGDWGVTHIAVAAAMGTAASPRGEGGCWVIPPTILAAKADTGGARTGTAAATANGDDNSDDEDDDDDSTPIAADGAHG